MKPETEVSESLRTVLTGASIGVVGKVFSTATEFLFTIILSRTLGVVLLGHYFFGLSIFRFLHVFSVGGLDYAARRYVGTTDKLTDLLIRFGRRWGSIAFIVYLVLIVSLLGLIPNFMSGTERNYVIIWFIIAAPINAFISIVAAVFQGLKQIKISVLLQDLLLPISRVVIFLILFFYGFRLAASVQAYLLSACIVGVISLYVLRKGILRRWWNNKTIKISTDAVTSKVIRGYSSPMMMITVINLFVIWGTTFILGILSRPEEVSAFAVSARLVSVVNLFLMSVNMVFEPVSADLFHLGERVRIKNIYRQITIIILIVIFPVAFLGILFSGSIVTLFGEGFSYSAVLLSILLVGQFVGVLAGPAGNLLVMAGYQRESLAANILISSIVITLDFLLIPRFGTIAAAIIVGFGLAARNSFALFILLVKERIHPFSASTVQLLIITVVGILFAAVFRNSLGGYVFAAFYMAGFAYIGYTRGYFQIAQVVFSKPR